MKGDSIEVYCQNKECGEPEVHKDIIGHHETMRYRRMNYMGSKEVRPAVVVVKHLLDKETPPSGTYFLYQCPVCGAKRAYHDSGGMIKEVDTKVIDEIAA
jgi:hypothetical protein